MIIPGQTLYVLECEPAAYASLAANERKGSGDFSKSSFDRVYLGGEEQDIDVWRAAVAASKASTVSENRTPKVLAEALGMVEASDAMVKAAKVELVSYEKTGGGYVTAVVRGDVAAVKAAIDAGIRGAEKVGEVIATHVIARPHLNIDLVLPLGRQEQAAEELG